MLPGRLVCSHILFSSQLIGFSCLLLSSLNSFTTLYLIEMCLGHKFEYLYEVRRPEYHHLGRLELGDLAWSTVADPLRLLDAAVLGLALHELSPQLLKSW